YKRLISDEANAKQCIAKLRSMGENLPDINGNTTAEVNVESMFANFNHSLNIPVEISDFIDLDFYEKFNSGLVNVVGVTGASLVAFGANAKTLHNFLKLSNVLSIYNMRKIVLPVLGLASIGLAYYLVLDIQNTIPRKVSRKIQKVLEQENYIDRQMNKIVRQDVIVQKNWQDSKKDLNNKKNLKLKVSILLLSFSSNFHLSIDESVFSALLECAYSDPKHQVIGYLGGKCSIGKSDMIICHVSQFVALERCIPSLLTDTVKEINLAYEETIKKFKDMGLILVGWYRSAGIIISISTTGFPSLGPKGQISDGITNTFCIFRTSENTILNDFDAINTPSQGTKSKNGKISKGKGKELPKVNRTILHESKQVYNEQILDCENRIGQKVFVDSQYESFLLNFLRKSVVQFDRSVDQDFRSLSIAKHHAKMLISKHLNETLGILQQNKIKDENQLNLWRRKLEKLIENMAMQRLSKKEKEMKKNNPSEFDLNKWPNLTSSLESQVIINQDNTINYANGSDTLLGYKLSENFKEFTIKKNELDLMNEKSDISSTNNKSSTLATIENRVIRKTSIEYIM
ncbi:1604_t:CDS:10, partial [Entrophospora sp. SA101]